MNVLEKEIRLLQNWVGGEERNKEVLTSFKVLGYYALLDYEVDMPREGDLAPNGIHWMLARSLTPQSLLDQDGHSRKGEFMPPVSLPRRMWASSRIEFIQPLRVGESINRLSRIDSVFLKYGHTGPLIFIDVEHHFSGSEGLCIREMQTLVYREFSDSDANVPRPEPAPVEAKWCRILEPDSVFLFRYSALTFNGHRIHYDRTYSMKEEGYPGLVVHGPLQATLLLDLCRRKRPDTKLKQLEFRAKCPLFDGEEILVCGNPDGHIGFLWITGPQGQLAMQALAEWETD